jgi:hypothetical protein
LTLELTKSYADNQTINQAAYSSLNSHKSLNNFEVQQSACTDVQVVLCYDAKAQHLPFLFKTKKKSSEGEKKKHFSAMN